MAKPRNLVTELWNWERCKNQIRNLRGRLGFPDAEVLKFLRLNLSLDDGSIYDELKGETVKGSEVGVYFVLYGYANAKPAPETSTLISFKELLGGQAYCKAFAERSIQPLADLFSLEPQMLVEAAKHLDGTPQAFGEYSAKIYALPQVPLTIILWAASEEFGASANILFDFNANSYLSTEELAGLGGLTCLRLKDALEVSKNMM